MAACLVALISIAFSCWARARSSSARAPSSTTPGTQAAKALKEEGYEVVLVNSNPATIMTDPEFADRTYIEPVTPEFVELVIAREQPDALLPTMGGQTALNVAMKLATRTACSSEYGVELIGANARAIRAGGGSQRCSPRRCGEIGLAVPTGRHRDDRWTRPRRLLERVGFPAIIRPSFTLGGTGGGIAYNRDEYEDDRPARARPLARRTRCSIEQSVLGWKEYELEVMRDHDDNVVIVCSIENLDPMGVHTGDSITVAPAMTLTDREYQRMRDAAIAVIREIGVDAGGCNIQFAVNPRDGDDARDRDESARVAVIGARIQGHRVSDRADRHEACRRVPAG